MFVLHPVQDRWSVRPNAVTFGSLDDGERLGSIKIEHELEFGGLYSRKIYLRMRVRERDPVMAYRPLLEFQRAIHSA